MLLVSVVATTLVCSTQPQNSCTDTVSPPMGWNSYDMTIGNHGINSSFAIQAAHFIHDNLQPLGYNYITLDSGWFGTDSTYEGDGAGQTVDEYGRLVPNRTYYPDGFRPLKEVVEKLGLKWGFWIMGGIPRVAVQQKSKIKGTNFTADQVADLTNTTNCPWNKWLVYGSKRLADGSIHPGAAAYYDSIAELYSEWGVDIIKMDCVFGGNYYGPRSGKLEMDQFATSIRKASSKSVLLSLSPGGGGPGGSAAGVNAMAEVGTAFVGEAGAANGMQVMARMTGDFWDGWAQLYDHFTVTAPVAARYTSNIGLGSFYPDLDMLPIGWVAHVPKHSGGQTIYGRYADFNLDESQSLLAQWAMARAPLMWGGQPTQDKVNATTMGLIGNPEVLAVGQSSCGNRQTKFSANISYWAAEAVGGQVVPRIRKYIAIFNIGETERDVELDLHDPASLLPGPPFESNAELTGRDLWMRESSPTVAAAGIVKATLRPHASLLLLVSEK